MELVKELILITAAATLCAMNLRILFMCCKLERLFEEDDAEDL